MAQPAESDSVFADMPSLVLHDDDQVPPLLPADPEPSSLVLPDDDQVPPLVPGPAPAATVASFDPIAVFHAAQLRTVAEEVLGHRPVQRHARRLQNLDHRLENHDQLLQSFYTILDQLVQSHSTA